MRRFLVTNPNLSVGKLGDIVSADQLHMSDEKLDEWAYAGFGMELFDLIDDVLATNDGPYEPGEHTVSQVRAYMADHPDEMEAVVEAEMSGKNRSSIINGE